MITIAVDAMGGDHAPRPEVEGSILAARELGVRVLLVGMPAEIKRELAQHSNRGLSIEIVPASEVIAMSDSPAHAFRKKKDSSAHVAARLVRQGQADALVSAGNTGAVMTVARFVLGTLPSVQRPALAAPLPDQPGRRDGADRRRRQRRFQGGPPAAVRGDGRDLLSRDFRHPAAQGGAALHRRRRDQGQRAHARSAQSAEGPAAQFCRQRRRPRDFLRERGRRSSATASSAMWP